MRFQEETEGQEAEDAAEPEPEKKAKRGRATKGEKSRAKPAEKSKAKKGLEPEAVAKRTTKSTPPKRSEVRPDGLLAIEITGR